MCIARCETTGMAGIVCNKFRNEGTTGDSYGDIPGTPYCYRANNDSGMYFGELAGVPPEQRIQLLRDLLACKDHFLPQNGCANHPHMSEVTEQRIEELQET